MMSGELFVELSPEIAYYGANSKSTSKTRTKAGVLWISDTCIDLCRLWDFVGGQTNTEVRRLLTANRWAIHRPTTGWIKVISVFRARTYISLMLKDVSIYNGFKTINEVTLDCKRLFRIFTVNIAPFGPFEADKLPPSRSSVSIFAITRPSYR